MSEFRFPDVGEGITEGEIVKWRVKEGEKVKQDQVLVEVETDKAVVQLPSPASGKVLKIYYKEGKTVKVGEVLVTISGETKTEKKSTTVIGELKESGYVLPPPKEYFQKGKNPPLSLEKKRLQYPKETTIQTQLVTKKYDMWGYIDHVPLKGVRKSIAKNLSESVRTAVHVTHMDIADITSLEYFRENEAKQAEKRKIKLTFLPYIVKAVVASLKEHPYLNSSINEEGEDIVLKKYYNIGIAVDTCDGLIVPVIKGADQKNILEIAKEIEQLAEKTRQRKVDLMDLRGGTFTITNVGSIGGVFATPIINQPEVAILALGRIHDRPVGKDGKVVLMKALPLSLTFDHRVVDGAEAAKFTNTLKGYLAKPEKLK